jgi:hypothetical protein
VIDAGTGKLADVELRVTAVAAAAALLSVALQIVEPPEVRVSGLHTTELTLRGAATCGIVMAPAAAVTVSAAPAAVTPIAAGMPILAVVAVAVSVAVTTATTPLEMTLVLMPETIQVYAAAPPEQATDFPAATEAAPAVTLTLAILPAG